MWYNIQVIICCFGGVNNTKHNGYNTIDNSPRN